MRVGSSPGLLILLGGLSLTACKPSDQPQPPPEARAERGVPPAPSTPSRRTVAAFRADSAELDATLRRCRNDPGGLGQTPDCLNAAEAARQRTADEMKRALQ